MRALSLRPDRATVVVSEGLGLPEVPDGRQHRQFRFERLGPQCGEWRLGWPRRFCRQIAGRFRCGRGECRRGR
jgi:hypothetical protein